MNVFYANCKYENWDACKEHSIFGVKKSRLPSMERGDLVLLRLTSHTGGPYGVRAIWAFDESKPVEEETFVPWTDDSYKWIIYCTSLAELTPPFSEEFGTSSKVSTKIQGLYATRIRGSLGALKPKEATAYIEGILSEFGDDLGGKLGDGRNSVVDLLYDVLEELRGRSGVSISRKSIPTFLRGSSDNMHDGNLIDDGPNLGVVGERIDLPILNYAPLNEMGVVSLFSFYMHDLGFSHLEEIRAVFPDAIGMQRIDDHRFKRVRIEFEFKSRNFLKHGHSADQCDVIVCWENNWDDCPLEVIELKSELFPG